MGFGLEHGLNNTLSIGTNVNYALGTAMLSFVPEVRAYLTGSEAVSGFYVGGYGLALYTGGADAAGMAGASLGFQKAIGDRITMDVGTGVGGQFRGGSSNINIRPGVTLAICYTKIKPFYNETICKPCFGGVFLWLLLTSRICSG